MDNPFAETPEKKEEITPPVPQTQAPQEAVQPPLTQVPPVTEAPQATEAPIIEEAVPKDEDGEELLIENDGNVFWIFQKVAWSVLKMVLVGGLIGLLIWIIWKPSNNPLNEIHRPLDKEEVTREEKKVIPEKKVIKKVKEKDIFVETPTVSALPENYAYKAALWANWMEDSRQAANKQILSRSLYWAKRAEGFFTLTTSDLLVSEIPEERAKNIDGVLFSLRGMLEESRGIRMTLNSELDRASAQSRASEAGMLDHDRQLSSSIGILDGDRAEFLLSEKSRLYQDFVAQNSKITAYHFVLNRVQSSVPLLQEIHDNILANRQVLIDNVQVVGFPSDRFHRILTPAEWQGIRE